MALLCNRWNLLLGQGLLLLVAVATVASPAAAQQRDLAAMASTGELDKVLAALPDQPTSAAARALKQDITRHLEHEVEREQERQAAFDKAMAELVEQTREEKISEALSTAIYLRSLTPDADSVLNHEEVFALVTLANDAALKAEERGDWLTALDYYRSLDALFDDRQSYQPQVRRIQHRQRLLSLYAPQKLHALYVKRAEVLGIDGPGPLDEDGTHWRTYLRGIDHAMVRRALYNAAKAHIYGKGYRPLLIGGVDNLLAFSQVHEVAQSFPVMDDEAKLAEFRRRLTDLKSEIARPGWNPNFIHAKRLIQTISDINANTLELPDEVILHEFTVGATGTLDDFSDVIWPAAREDFLRTTTGKFSGVGIQISRDNGQLVVISPLENTPAQRAGIKAGDIIAKVDGKDTTNWNLDHAVRAITGPEGTFVTLGVKRPGEPDLLIKKIQRAQIELESVRGWEHRTEGGWDFYIDPTLKVGYVRVSSFLPNTVDDLDAAITQMEEQGGVNGLVLDLRNNPGGLLSTAVELVDRFVEEGDIVSTVDASNTPTASVRAQRHKTYPPFPVVVLINNGSASASEIVSGALQAHNRAVIVGARSYGKGSVQDIFPISSGQAQLKLTTQYYRLPDKRIIHRQPGAETWGIEPDIAVYMTPEELGKAIEFRQAADIIRSAEELAEMDEPAKKPDEILINSLDPQLSVALLVLKTQIVGDQAIARK